MGPDDALTGDYRDDLAAVVADSHAADVIAEDLRKRFCHLQRIEARRLLNAEYQCPAEVRRDRSVLRGEAIHHAFARLCAEAGRERQTPLVQVAARWGERARAERQLEALIAASPSSPPETGSEDKKPARRRSPAIGEWAGMCPDSTYEHLRLYHVPSIHMLMSNLIL